MSTAPWAKRDALVVFAKDPRPGQVKTRMTPPLSPDVAAAFYREMLVDVLNESARACSELGLDGVLAVTPAASVSGFYEIAPRDFSVVAQSGKDLGARMAHEVSRSLAAGCSRVVLRGSDNPALGRDELARLHAALGSVDLAASPDPDGGYGAIGLRVPAHTVFDHEMSTRDVLQETLGHAREQGLTTTTTEGSFDLDSVDDLATLAALRNELPDDRCPKTLAFADAHGLWPRSD